MPKGLISAAQTTLYDKYVQICVFSFTQFSHMKPSHMKMYVFTTTVRIQNSSITTRILHALVFIPISLPTPLLITSSALKPWQPLISSPVLKSVFSKQT